MFAFGWLLVPMYDVFCEITGLNGKVTGPSSLSKESLAITEQRELLVQFMTHNNESMPWVFDSEKSQSLTPFVRELEETTEFLSIIGPPPINRLDPQ